MTLVAYTAVEAKELVRQTLQRDSFSFDVETIGTDPETGADIRLSPWRNTVVWLSVATDGLSYVVPMGHPHGEQIGTKKEPRVGRDGKTRQFNVPDWAPAPRQLRPADAFEILEPMFFSEDHEKSGCNVKFDLETISKYYEGEFPVGPYFDTQIAGHAINENQHEYRLGTMVKREFKFSYDKTVGEQIERYGFKAAARYSHADSVWDRALRQKYKPLLAKDDLEGMWALEMDVLTVCLAMEQEGALLDVEAAAALKVDLERQMAQLKGTLWRLAGREINLNSTDQLRDLLFGAKRQGGFGLKSKKLTKGGKTGENKKPSTAADALALHEGHPFVDTYLQLQEVDKIHGTYLTAYLGGEVTKTQGDKTFVEVRPSILIEDKIHASFKQHGTVTGRFSCSTPNLQNIPRPGTELGTQVRGLFVAPDRHHLVVADYGQIEYVVMAHFSRDPMLVRAFNEDLDLHQYVAGMVFGIDMDAVTKAQRTTAKNTNFAVAYGAGEDKVAAMSKITLEEAQRFRAAHRKLLPKLYRWTEKEVADCRRRKPPHVTTLLGRKRRLPQINSTNWWQKSEAERQAVNTKVQGSAADIIKLAMVRLHALCDDELRLSLTVHDELVLVVPDDRVEDGQRVMREAMLGEGIQSMLSVPMKIDMKVVDRWSEAK